MSAAKLAPRSGQPFAIVGTEEARATIESFRLDALSLADLEERATDAPNGAAAGLLSVLAHRDHLAAQVTELQAGSTATLLRSRETLSADRLLHCENHGCVPHRYQPSPETGPAWRCSECGAVAKWAPGSAVPTLAPVAVREPAAEVAECGVEPVCPFGTEGVEVGRADALTCDEARHTPSEATAADAARRIAALFYDGDLDAEWNADTLQAVDRILIAAGLRPGVDES